MMNARSVVTRIHRVLPLLAYALLLPGGAGPIAAPARNDRSIVFHRIQSFIILSGLASAAVFLVIEIFNGNAGVVFILSLHVLLLSALLLRFVSSSPGQSDIGPFVLLNLITWPLLQELLGGMFASGCIILWSVLAPATAGFSKERKYVARVFLLFLCMIIISALVEPYRGTTLDVVLLRQALELFTPTVIGLVFISYRSAHVLFQHSKLIIEAMTIQYQRIESSIRYAQTIQTASLPKRSHLASCLGEHHLLIYGPKDVVSGDFYWVAEKDHRIILAVADCTGHGVPGGFMTMLGINSLNHIILDKGVTDPAMILHYLHHSVRESFERSSARITDGMDIGVCSIDRQKGIVTYAGAMSSLYHVNGSLNTHGSVRASIGEAERTIAFTNTRIPASTGDRFYLLSDGFTDQFGGPRDKRFGSRRWRALLTSIAGEPMPRQEEILQAEFKAWRGQVEQCDDILVVGFTI